MVHFRLLNLGCGDRYDESWVNVDFTNRGRPGVKAHNLLAGIPYPTAVFEAVYHSHVLEHFPREAAFPFIAECFRVLRPGGILRVVVPDFERICRTYLSALDGALRGDIDAERNYEWMVLELFDQFSRTSPGGGMAKHLTQLPVHNRDFVVSRIGSEALRFFEHGPDHRAFTVAVRNILRRAKRRVAGWDPRMFLLTRADRRALRTGRFRNGGEIHQWMYDRYSLQRLLTGAGFRDVGQVTPFESAIPGWSDYKLDADEHGTHKPDSIFLEGRRPL
jgi:SAM-dependent methyltransferase